VIDCPYGVCSGSRDRRNRVQNGGFRGKRGSKCYILDLWPRKGTSLARNRVVWLFYIKIRAGVLAPPPQKKIAESTLVPRGANSRIRGKGTPDPIWKTFRRVVGIRDIITPCKFRWRSVKGLWGGGGHFFPFHIDFDRRLCNTVALSYECVIFLVHRTATSLSGTLRTLEVIYHVMVSPTARK